MIAVRVKDGTNAGRRIIKPAPKPWVHVCRDRPTDGGAYLEASFARCPVCGTRRP